MGIQFAVQPFITVVISIVLKLQDTLKYRIKAVVPNELKSKEPQNLISYLKPIHQPLLRRFESAHPEQLVCFTLQNVRRFNRVDCLQSH